MSASKTLITVASVAMALVFGGGAYLYTHMGLIAKHMAERIASETMEVDVNIGKLDIILKDKTVVVSNLRIGNPKGYEGPYAAKIDNITLRAETLSDVLLRFKDIDVTGTEVFLEVREGGTNLTQIKKNVDTKAAGGDQAAKQIKVIIENLRIEKMKVIPTILLVGNQKLDPITVPDLVLRGIGVKENGVLAREAIGQIWANITRKVSQSANSAGLLEGMSDEALKDMGATKIQELQDRATHSMDKIGNDLKRIIGE
jgi:hypothetical protein